MKLVLSHPTGNEFVRAAAKGFLEADMLTAFYTSIASFEGSLFDRLGKIGPFSELHRRRFDTGLQKYTSTSPFREAGRMLSMKAGFSRLTAHETGLFSVDAVYNSLDKKVASDLKKGLSRKIDGVYAYEDAAMQSFLEAKKHGLTCFYDLPIGYWRTARKLLSLEAERWPDWASTLIGLSDSELKLNKKDEELRLSDCIFVASSFTASTLKDYPGQLAPVKVIPYAFPQVGLEREYNTNNKKPLKLLFVGGLSQRKGIADLFDVVNKLGRHVELTIVGRKTNSYCAALEKELVKHKWIPSLPHGDVLKIMRENDVLIFPSLFEGFGLVITEAMAQGTPVITTERTAGPDLIRDGDNGWIINAGSVVQLQSAVENLISNRNHIVAAGKEALNTASKRPWRVYGQELVDAVINVNNK